MRVVSSEGDVFCVVRVTSSEGCVLCVVRVMCGCGGGEGEVWRWGVVRVMCGGGVW